MNMFQLFKVGDEIHGYCQGYFGRDDYESKTCVFVNKNYAVFENYNGEATVVNYYEGFDSDVEKWKNDKPVDDY